MSGSARKRLACDECTRKKIKCDKAIPCNHCIRKGLQDVCSRDGDLQVNRQPSDASPTITNDPPSRQPQVIRQDDPVALIASLSAKVSELENAVRGIAAATPAPTFSPDRAPAARPTPFPGHAPTPISAPSPAPRPPANGMPGPDVIAADSEAADAASILEFLAWGRRKDPDYSTVVSPGSGSAPNRANGLGDAETEGALGHGMIEAELSQLGIVQMLLPSRKQIERLVAYHEECLLWYHGSFYPLSFHRQLGEFFDRHHGNIESDGVDLQWAALLFSVITGSMCCAPLQQVREWGFTDGEQTTLSRQWLRAVSTCLNAGEFMAQHSINAVEAIATLTISAHLLGYSNNQSVLLASAVRIAQSLGLHRLSSQANDPKVERGRRVWCQLCTQDWFGVPFSESYAINPLYCQHGKPTNYHDEDPHSPLPDSVPTRVGYPRFLHDIARLMPQLQDGIALSNTLYTKYEQVLKYDKQMRALATTHRPHFLSSTPVDPTWPRWVPWARRSLAMSSAHKIIMIHRSFLGPSFTNSPFSFTRRTCIAASKTILKEQKQTIEPDAPHLWIYDAFSIAACIILCLDLFYHDQDDAECDQHRQLVEEAVDILRQSHGSLIAQRGVRVINALLTEVQNVDSGSENPLKRKANELQPNVQTKRRRPFDVPSFVKKFCDQNGQKMALGLGEDERTEDGEATETPLPQQNGSQASRSPSEGDESYTHRLIREAEGFPRSNGIRNGPISDVMSPRATFEGVSSFENLLFLAQTYLT